MPVPAPAAPQRSLESQAICQNISINYKQRQIARKLTGEFIADVFRGGESVLGGVDVASLADEACYRANLAEFCSQKGFNSTFSPHFQSENSQYSKNYLRRQPRRLGGLTRRRRQQPQGWRRRRRGAPPRRPRRRRRAWGWSAACLSSSSPSILRACRSLWRGSTRSVSGLN